MSASNQPRILYEDNHLLGIFKPAGFPTQPDHSGDPSLLDWAKSWLAEHYEKKGQVFLGMVHRLDRPVSGVILFARTSKAASRLSEQFRKGSVEKIYWALVSCDPSEPIALGLQTLRHYLKSAPQNKMVASLEETAGSRLGVLHFCTLDRSHPKFSQCTFLEIRLETGRKHQIRAQLAASGHPIVGDRKYGSRISLKPGRIALLAKRLVVAHPITHKPVVLEMEVASEWPKG